LIKVISQPMRPLPRYFLQGGCSFGREERRCLAPQNADAVDHACQTDGACPAVIEHMGFDALLFGATGTPFSASAVRRARQPPDRRSRRSRNRKRNFIAKATPSCEIIDLS
jgi:hypothetical protein